MNMMKSEMFKVFTSRPQVNLLEQNVGSRDQLEGTFDTIEGALKAAEPWIGSDSIQPRIERGNETINIWEALAKAAS
tara:strand:+ start:487 stop:717 length:231 start_codon:yes stop_codon:yes gene_type:complete